MIAKKDDLIRIGAILGAKGLKGEVLVKYFSENFSAFKNYSYFFIGNINNKFNVTNFSIRKENISVSLKQINNRTDAEKLKGQEIFIEKIQLKDLEGDEWYHQDLIGLDVELSSGKK